MITEQPPRWAFLSSPRWQLGWQISLNLVLLLSAFVLWKWVTWRAVYFMALVPIAIVPFSYSRLRFHSQCVHMFGSQSALLALFAILGMFCDATMIAQILTARSGSPLPFLHSPGIAWIGTIWFSTYGLLLLGYATIGILRIGQRGVQWLLQQYRQRQPDAPPSLGRRQFLQQLGLVGAGAPFFFSLSSVKLTYDFRVEEREISLPSWPKALDGLRIAHLSDIHVGGGMDLPKLLDVAALTNAAKPDIVLHTGDFLTHRTGNFDAPLYEALAQIRAPYGQWACLGNHDFDAPRRLVHHLRRAGVITLRDRVITLPLDGRPIELAGIDFLFQRFDQAALYQRIVTSWGPRESASRIPRLLLNHDPRTFTALPDGCADLVLSGHTHGGHVGIQLGKDHALSIVGLLGIPDQGIFHRKDMQMFVTRCVGFYGYPMRLGIPPEISILTLRAPDTVSL